MFLIVLGFVVVVHGVLNFRAKKIPSDEEKRNNLDIIGNKP